MEMYVWICMTWWIVGVFSFMHYVYRDDGIQIDNPLSATTMMVVCGILGPLTYIYLNWTLDSGK